MSTPATYLLIGMGIHLVFWLGHKLLRKKWVLVSAIILSGLLAFIAFNYQGIDSLQMKGGYAANLFFSPAMFLITYTLCRYFFKLIFKNEPIMSGYLSTNWEQGEYRKLHMGDSMFTVITLILPVVFPLFI